MLQWKQAQHGGITASVLDDDSGLVTSYEIMEPDPTDEIPIYNVFYVKHDLGPEVHHVGAYYTSEKAQENAEKHHETQ